MAFGLPAISTWGDIGTIAQIGGSVLGGIFGGKQKRTRYGDLIKGLLGSRYAPELGRNYTYSEALGKHEANMLKARVDGAWAAGVHPAVALGMPPSGGVTMSVGGDDAALDLAGMGQDIGSALSRLQTPDQKTLSDTLARQSVERGDLENELLKTQIAQIRSSMTPGIISTNAGEMIAGQGDTGANYINNELIKHQNASGMEAGTLRHNSIPRRRVVL